MPRRAFGRGLVERIDQPPIVAFLARTKGVESMGDQYRDAENN
jgi:hypothetical protein